MPKPAIRNLLLGIFLAVATLAVYYPVHGHPFANFDDDQYVSHNLRVQAGLTASTVRWAFTTDALANWHPLTWLTHAANCDLFGLDPAGHHDVNLMLHVLNVLLLYWVLLNVTGLAGRSAMVAGLFALHPINVESVAWISELKNLLSMVFFLLALEAYRRYAHRPNTARYLLIALLFALGLLAKPQVVTFPFLLLLWDFWPLGRLSPTATDASNRTSSTAYPPATRSRLLLEKLPLLALALADALLTMRAQRVAGALSFTNYSLPVRLENALVSYVLYLRKAFWPVDLALLYPHPGTSLASWQVASAAVVLILISALAVLLRHRRYFFVGWFWFVGSLVPMIGIVQVSRQAMADRYAYLSFIGLFLALVWGVADAAQRFRIPTRVITGFGVAVLLVLSALTYRQDSYWSDNLTLWTHALDVTHGNFVAENIVGTELIAQNRWTEAAAHFRSATAINPTDASAFLYLGMYQQHENKQADAVDYYRKAIALSDSAPQQNAFVRYNAFARLGTIYRDRGDVAQARDNFQRAAEANPGDPSLWFEVGIANYRLGDPSAAAAAFSRAIKLRPSDLGYLLLARALERSGRIDEARAAFAQAQRVTPNLQQAEQVVDSALSPQR